MKKIILSSFFVLAFPNTTLAAPLAEPQLNHCSSADGIEKCEVKCARSLGAQCLIMHIKFEGQNLKPNTNLLRAKFITCKNANLDLQIKSLTVELEKLDKRETEAILTSTISASGKTINLNEHDKINFDETKVDARLSRTYFKEFINSGDSFVEAEINLKQCGHTDGSNSCKISGTLVAVTDPNISCDFHNTTEAGAYRPANLQISPSLQNSQKPIGRIGQ